MCFSIVISGFAGHKIVTVWKGGQQVQQPVQEDKPVDKNLDCQGDDNVQ